MGFNPSLSKEKNHPVEMLSWYDAVKYCNKLSESKGLEKYYKINNIVYVEDKVKEDNLKPGIHLKSIDSATVEKQEGKNGYRLPTKDEWEYAARGGKNGNITTYAGSDNLNKVGWYRDNSKFDKLEELINKNDNLGDKDLIEFMNNNPMTEVVGEKNKNELGIYDMPGNVWELTNTSKNSRKMARGGSYKSPSKNCKVTSLQYPHVSKYY